MKYDEARREYESVCKVMKAASCLRLDEFIAVRDALDERRTKLESVIDRHMRSWWRDGTKQI